MGAGDAERVEQGEQRRVGIAAVRRIGAAVNALPERIGAGKRKYSSVQVSIRDGITGGMGFFSGIEGSAGSVSHREFRT
jgi:hypothetical protein